MEGVGVTKVDTICFSGTWTHESAGQGIKSTAGEGASAIIKRSGGCAPHTLDDPPAGTMILWVGTVAVITGP